MGERKVHVWHLEVDWPNAADFYQWGGVGQRNYLTHRGAKAQAARLRSHGAQVTIVKSKPVEWDSP